MLPINKLFECLLSENRRYADMVKVPKMVKFKRIMAVIVGVLATLATVFAIYVLAANKTEDQNNSWKYDFLFVIAVDLFLTPLLIVLF